MQNNQNEIGQKKKNRIFQKIEILRDINAQNVWDVLSISSSAKIKKYEKTKTKFHKEETNRIFQKIEILRDINAQNVWDVLSISSSAKIKKYKTTKTKFHKEKSLIACNEIQKSCAQQSHKT